MSTKELANRVRDERKRRKWTQQEMAERASLSLRAYQMFELGQSTPQPGNLRAILAAVDINQNGDSPEDGAPEWPRDVQVFLNMLGAYVMALPEDDRMETIDDVTRQIFERRK
jgi:transcriptional regulator with XRE-family HTH domain